MFKSIRFTFFALILLALSQVAFTEAHDILLEDIDGNQHSLDEYIGKGKWVVVNIWGTACPYCRHELFDLTSFHDRHHQKDAIVLGLTLDWPSFDFPDKDYLADFAMDYFIDYPLLMVDAELATKVIGKPVDMIPLTFLYNPEGKLILRINGVVTETMLEKAITTKNTSYHVQWSEVIPPEFEPE